MLSNLGGGMLDHAIWGFLPNWAKGGPDQAKPLINARAETVAHRPAFRTAVRYHRCIIPASGFYEWKQTSSDRQPYHITLADGKPMLMAGLWEDSHDGAGSEIRTACVITTAASESMRELYHRMPAILTPEDAIRWVKAPDSDALSLTEMLAPSGQEFTKTPVSRLVNSPANDTKECIEPMPSDDEPTLFG